METQTELTRPYALREGSSHITINYDTIRAWVEARGGYPAAVKSPHDPNPLRVEFPGYRGNEWLEPISWDAFFERFDDQNLAFLYQENASDGTVSRFCRFVPRR